MHIWDNDVRCYREENNVNKSRDERHVKAFKPWWTYYNEEMLV